MAPLPDLNGRGVGDTLQRALPPTPPPAVTAPIIVLPVVQKELFTRLDVSRSDKENVAKALDGVDVHVASAWGLIDERECDRCAVHRRHPRDQAQRLAEVSGTVGRVKDKTGFVVSFGCG